MESAKNNICISKKELQLLSLVEEKCFGEQTKLLNQNDIENIDINEFTFAFSPNKELNPDFNSFKENYINLICDEEVVGKITNVNVFKSDKIKNNIFNYSYCPTEKEEKTYISGDVKIINNYFHKIKKEFQEKVKSTNAKKITAIFLNADPITRAHERMLRWTIDKADIVVIFVIEGYENNSLSFELKKECFEYYAKNFLPLDRIFPIYLKHLDLFNPNFDPNYECLLASSFGANKIVIGQNHQGLGLFYDNNLAHTAIDELAQKSGLELIVLPEFVFCNKCNVMVSTKSCPHGSHHHIKYRSGMIRQMLNAGLIPPSVLVRKEISAKLLAHMHPNRFHNIQALYDGLFPSNGIIEKRSDEDLYKELITLYQASYMI